MARFRSGTPSGEMESGHPGHHDLFGDERQKDGKAVTDEAAEGRALGNRVIKSRKEAEIEGKREENSPKKLTDTPHN